MKKEKLKKIENIYFEENIDSKGAFYADKSVFLFSSIMFLATFLVFLVFQIVNYKDESYLPNLLQLFGGLVFTCVPLVLRRFKLYVNSYLAIVWYLFMIATFYLGLNFEVYKMGVWYDKIVHLVSGAVVGLIALTFVNMNGKRTNKFSIFLTVVAFAGFLGLVWEVIEFTFDGIFGDNSQRYADIDTGVPFVGREALYDSMYDMIADLLGGILMAIALMFISHKNLSRLAIQLKSNAEPIAKQTVNDNALIIDAPTEQKVIDDIATEQECIKSTKKQASPKKDKNNTLPEQDIQNTSTEQLDN